MTTPDGNDKLITQRLGHALEAEARDNPLPSDFSASIATRLGDRSARRIRPLVAVSAIAVTVVLAVVAAGISVSWLSAPPSPVSSGADGEQHSLEATSSATAPSATAHSTPEASPEGLTEAEAVEAALMAADRPGMTAVHVAGGPASEVVPRDDFEWAHVPSENTWVWFVVLSDGGPPLGAEGSWVILDYFDGTIYGVQDWIS